MSTDVERIVEGAVAKYQGLSPFAVREIVETTAEAVRADLLLKFQEFQSGITTVISAPASAKKATSKKAKGAAKDGEKKPRKPLSPEARKKLAANLEKARAAKAKKAKKAKRAEKAAKTGKSAKSKKANEARSAAMKKSWADRKKKAAKK